MKPSLPWPRRGLYLLTPDENDTARLLARTRPALAAGVALLQYRNKSAHAALRHEQALALQALCAAHNTPLIINDDWRLAAEIAADGAHLGSDDGDLQAARSALGPDAILGVSCYDELARAEHAIAAGASYLAFGAFFPSSTKPLARTVPLVILNQARRFGLPLVAIGGITPENAPLVIKAGATMVAAISAVFDAPDPANAVRHFNACFE